VNRERAGGAGRSAPCAHFGPGAFFDRAHDGGEIGFGTELVTGQLQELGDRVDHLCWHAKRRAFGATLAELRRDYEAIKP